MNIVQARRTTSVDTLVQGVLEGNRLLIARAISRIEGESDDAHAMLGALFPHTGHAHIIGVTGVPGTGKSTLVTTLAQHYRMAGMSVGIVAIDPSSPFSGGALLGDRVRMRALSGDSGVFIRSMATRGSLGGLSKTTGDVVSLLDAAGFERIIVETVGVGQAEVEIASTAHTTIVVEAPGMGDEVQAIKAGILEIADILVVNKADRPGADRTVQALALVLEIENSRPHVIRHHGQLIHVEMPPDLVSAQEGQWPVTVMKTMAMDGEGVAALRIRIEEHRAWLLASKTMGLREQLRIAHTLENILRAEINRRIAASLPTGALNGLVEAVQKREIDPYRAARVLLADM